MKKGVIILGVGVAVSGLIYYFFKRNQSVDTDDKFTMNATDRYDFATTQKNALPVQEKENIIVPEDKEPTIEYYSKPSSSDSQEVANYKEAMNNPIVSTSTSRLLRPADTPVSIEPTTPLVLNQLNMLDEVIRNTSSSSGSSSSSTSYNSVSEVNDWNTLSDSEKREVLAKEREARSS